jgi:hypothetical protein
MLIFVTELELVNKNSKNASQNVVNLIYKSRQLVTALLYRYFS